MPTIDKPINTKNSSAPSLTPTPNNTSLTVLFFAHSTGLAGSERSLCELVAELIEDHGTSCTVVCPGNGPLVDRLHATGAATLVEATLCWWTVRPAQMLESGLRNGARALLKLVPLLQNIKPDIVYTQSMTIPWGACAAALLDKPHIWSIGEFGELDHGLTFADPFPDVLEQIKSGASFIRTTSEAVRLTLFPDLPFDRVRTIYRHSSPILVSEPSTTAFRRTGATRLAVFGTLCEGKAQLDAVQATAQLVARGRDVELLLAGYSNRDYQKKVETAIAQHGLEDRINFCGFLSEPYPAMLAADIVLVCSRNEAFGRVVVEGMKLGRPVIYPESGGIPEYMVDGVTGLSYAPGNIEELTMRIEELIDNPSRAVEIGTQAKRYAHTRFERNAGDIVDIMKVLQATRESRRVAMPKRVVTSLASDAAQMERDLSNTRAELTASRAKLDAIKS